MKTRELEYELPPALIAQHPVPLRDESRLLVYERLSERVHERRFAELPDVIGDALVVVNDTKVVPARIPIEKPKGEVLLLERLDDADIRTAGATYLMYRGRHRHEAALIPFVMNVFVPLTT